MQQLKNGKPWLIVGLALAALASACGRTHGGGSGDAPPPSNSDRLPSLVGTWETGCSEGQMFGGAARNARYTFTADHTVLLSDVIFSDRVCNSEMVKVLVTGTYSLGGVDAKIPGTYDLDLKEGRLTLSLLDPTKKVVNPCSGGGYYLKGSVGCGSISDRYQVVKVAGKAMQLGNDDDTGIGESPSERPKILKNTVYTKAES